MLQNSWICVCSLGHSHFTFTSLLIIELAYLYMGSISKPRTVWVGNQSCLVKTESALKWRTGEAKKSENRKHHLGEWTMPELKGRGGRGFPPRLCSRRSGERGDVSSVPFSPVPSPPGPPALSFRLGRLSLTLTTGNLRDFQRQEKYINCEVNFLLRSANRSLHFIIHVNALLNEILWLVTVPANWRPSVHPPC